MIRLNQWSALIENCAYCHTKAVHVAVETPLFLLLYFRCYIHEITNIWQCEESKERLMNLKLNLIPSFLYSHLCNRDSVASFLTCDWSKVATISLAIPSFFLEKIKKSIIVKNRIRDSILKIKPAITDKFEAWQFPSAPFGNYYARGTNVPVKDFACSVKIK